MNITQIKKIRPKKNLIILGVALGMGLIAALVGGSFFANKIAEIEAKSKVKAKSTQVVVAKHILKAGEPLSTDNVAARDMPSEFVHAGVIKPDQFDSVAGRSLSVDVQPGEPILWGLLEGKKVATFSLQVPPGHRAMTVEIDKISSISGLLEPGDVVDLLVTLEKDKETSTGATKGKDKFVFPLMQGLRVLAADQRSIGDSTKNKEEKYTTVTLDVDVSEANNLAVAREVGKLTALLRNPTDPLPVKRTAFDVAKFMAPKTAPDRGIPILVGPGVGFPGHDRDLPKHGGANAARPAFDSEVVIKEVAAAASSAAAAAASQP